MASLTYSKWRLTTASPADGLPAATIRERQLQTLASYITQSAPPLPAPVIPPSPPVAGYVAWWDASKITGVSDGATLSSWADSSGNGNNLTVGTGSPTYYKTTPAKIINGLPVVNFLSPGQYFTSNSAAFNVGNPYTWIFIMQCDSVPTASNQVPWTTNQGTPAINIIGGTPAQMKMIAGLTPPVVGNVDANLHYWGFVFNSGSSIGQLDGTQTTGLNPGTQSPLSVGGYTTTYIPDSFSTAFNFLGRVCEIIFYASALTTTQLNSLRAYAQTKWGTP